jgi:hypothetical protein
MKVKKSKLKIGDKVIFIKGPINKLGKIGIITILFNNGALIKFNKNSFSSARFINLRKILNCDICKEKNLSEDEMNPKSINIDNGLKNKLSKNICLECS